MVEQLATVPDAIVDTSEAEPDLVPKISITTNRRKWQCYVGKQLQWITPVPQPWKIDKAHKHGCDIAIILTSTGYLKKEEYRNHV